MKKIVTAGAFLSVIAAATASGRTPWMRRYPDVSRRYLERWERSHPWLAPLREGRRLFYEGDLDVALKHLEEAVFAREDDGRLHYEIGYIHFVRGDVPVAEQRLELAADLLARETPPHEYLFNSRYLLGMIAEDTGRPDRALEHYASALELDPSPPALHYRRGVVHYRVNRREDARSDLSRALDLDPELGSARYLLGLINLRDDNLNEAKVEFRKALALGEEEAAVLFCLGEIAARREDWERAAAYYRKSLEKDPGLIEAGVARANTLYIMGDLAGAEEAFRDLSRREPSRGRWLYNLGVIARERGREEAASEYFRRALEISPDLDFYRRPTEDMEELSAAAHREYREGNYPRAAELYRQALLRDPFYLPARFNLARVYQADERLSRARREYERILRAEPEHVPTHLNLGIVLYRQDRNSPRAAYHLRRYLELNPGSRQAHLIRRYLREIRGW